MNEQIKQLATGEATFAAEHHNLVYRFLAENELSEDEYYDTVVFGFLNAVQKYLRHPEFQSYSFRNLAEKYMAREMINKQREENAIQIYSLSDRIDGAPPIEDTIADVKNAIEEALDLLDWQETLEVLKADDRRIVAMLAQGYEQQEIAHTLGIGLAALNRRINTIRLMVSAPSCLAA